MSFVNEEALVPERVRLLQPEDHEQVIVLDRVHPPTFHDAGDSVIVEAR